MTLKMTTSKSAAYALLPRSMNKAGYTVADGWAGSVIQKPLAIQKCDRQSVRQTDRQTVGPTDMAR